jgi:transmembrane sensor
MTAETETAAARASREATNWFLLLREEPDDADLRNRFEAWLAVDPMHARAWVATERTAEVMARVPPVDARRRSQSTARRPVKRLDARPWAAAVGAIAVAACLAFLVLPGLVLHLRADHATGAAEVRTVPLQDGSMMVLAPDSAVEIAYSTAERRVVLLAGEAFFTVQHEAARPFRVVTRGIETTDIGTEFDVRRGEEGAVVAVQTGSVRVDYPSASTVVSELLEAGQSLRVSWAGAVRRGELGATQVGAWRRRQLIAQDQPMGEVIDRLRPYFKGTIVMMDGALARRPVTGVYNLAAPADALRGIAEARGATVHEITPWVLVVTGP